MKNTIALSVASLLLFAATNRAEAHSPPELAERCAKAVNAVVERCQSAAAEETQRCVREIRRLLENGQREAAKEVARECIRLATERTRRCAERVKRICRACIEQLLEWGAPELARRVHRLCEESLEKLRSTLQRQKNAIHTALEG